MADLLRKNQWKKYTVLTTVMIMLKRTVVKRLLTKVQTRNSLALERPRISKYDKDLSLSKDNSNKKTSLCLSLNMFVY